MVSYMILRVYNSNSTVEQIILPLRSLNITKFSRQYDACHEMGVCTKRIFMRKQDNSLAALANAFVKRKGRPGIMVGATNELC